jgi:hypothetical protein
MNFDNGITRRLFRGFKRMLFSSKNGVKGLVIFKYLHAVALRIIQGTSSAIQAYQDKKLDQRMLHSSAQVPEDNTLNHYSAIEAAG